MGFQQADFQFEALDGKILNATRYEPNQGSKAIIQIYAGTVIPKSYYRSITEYLATQGFTVICFDYRGVGNNRPKDLRSSKAKIFDWARFDMAGLTDHLADHFPDHKQFILAHSMGGQIIGLMPNIQKIDAIYSVASSTGNWKNFSGKTKILSGLGQYSFIPILTKLKGYFPASSINWGPDWPAGIAYDLAYFGKGNHNMTTLASRKEMPLYFDQINCPFKAVYLEDDDMATPKVIDRYCSDFPNANIELQRIHPKDFGLPQIGHHGFFKGKEASQFWPDVSNWFSRQLDSNLPD